GRLASANRSQPMQKHPLVHSTHAADNNTAPLAKDGALENLEGRRKRSFGSKHVSACFPFIADVRNGASYAGWPVWSDSTMKNTRFVPLPKKAAMRVYHKAAKWNGSG